MVKVTQTRAKKFKLTNNNNYSLQVSVSDDGVVSITEDEVEYRSTTVTIQKEMLKALIEILKAEDK